MLIDSYKSSNRFIAQQCRIMSSLLMVKLDRKKVYEEDEFQLEQEQHCASVQQKLLKLHNEINKALRKTAEVRTLYREHLN